MMTYNQRIGVGLLLLSMGCSQYIHAAQEICVYDPMGASGDIFSLMKDYQLTAKSFGVDLKLVPYSDEHSVVKAFKNQRCDAAVLTDFSSRQFNSYTGSMNAIGAMTNNAMAKVVFGLMGNPKLDADMVSGDFEVAGIFPLGLAYIITKDRQLDNLSKWKGIRFAVLDTDPAQYDMVKKVGANPVPITIANMGSKFNSGQIDAMGVPILAFKAFELQKGMGTTGTMFRFPVTFVGVNVVTHRQAFPDGFGAKSRRWFAAQTPRLMDSVIRLDNSVPNQYWSELSTNDKVGYIRLMREMRVKLIKDGIYNKKMTTLLKKVRCQQDPTAQECAMNDE
jgi:hypothetical protein